jgi:glucose/arabinose dehydrogenase
MLKKTSLNNIFQFEGSSEPISLQFTLSRGGAGFVDEIGVFLVDDDLGTLSGITPGTTDYLFAALSQGKVIFSALSNSEFPNLVSKRQFTFDSNARLGFYLVFNSTTDEVLADLAAGRTPANVFFANADANTNRVDYSRVLELSDSTFTLAWEDQLGGGDRDFNDLVLRVQLTDTPSPPETALQGERELIDLRGHSGLIPVSINVNRDAAFDNTFGFYIVDDSTGRIGNLNPRDSGYAEAAMKNRVDFSPGLPGGVLLAPFLTADSTPEDFLAQNLLNQADYRSMAYFAFLKANPDGLDHIRLLGDNTFAFEDLFGGGDKDYNDLVIQVSFSIPLPTAMPTPSNNPPTIAIPIPNQNAVENTLFNFTLAANTFEDVDGDSLTYSAALADGDILPNWLSFEPSTGSFSGTPSNGDVGTLSVAVTADDTHGGTIIDAFDLVISNVDDTSPAEIRGTTWNDINGNAVQDASELGLAGWTIFLDQNQNGELDVDELSTTTDADGNYTFATLTPGTYTVAEVLQPGWVPTFPDSSGSQTVDLSADQSLTDVNFGNRADLQQIQLALTPIVNGLDNPTDITNAGDGSDRLFVVEQGGRIQIIENGELLATPFLDISERISSGGERGLLGMAFPPDYGSKGYFYVNYTDTNGDTVVARYAITDDPNIAAPDSEEIVLTIDQPFPNHNGGQLAFGPDGYLYIGMGDGGGAGDPLNNAQNPQSLLGKILRIDVESGGTPYAIPESNPFLAQNDPDDLFRDEIWALGLRNPWRFSFDRLTGDLFIADVGQNAYEEIDFQPATSRGGENYGWNIMEGPEPYNNNPADLTGLVLPVAEYDRSQGQSVTGGMVYRGDLEPTLQGVYVYGDFINGQIWGLRPSGSGWENAPLLDSPYGISTFGEDEAGNIYLADFFNGGIYSITV